jgi:hypothetical protein
VSLKLASPGGATPRTPRGAPLLTQIGGTGVFVSSLRESLLRGELTAERSLLAALEAGCSAPVGAYASALDAGRLRLDAIVLGERRDGLDVSQSSEMIVVREHGDADVACPDGLGRDVAGRMLARGAARLAGAPGSAVKASDALKSEAVKDDAVRDTAVKDTAVKDGDVTDRATIYRDDTHDD